MDNQKSNQDRVMKTLAVIGFLVLVILIAWIAIQVIRMIPSAFSSLASLVDSVNEQQEDVELNVAASKSVVNSRTSLEITWTDVGIPGTYTFSYSCVPGVSLNVKARDGETTPVTCESPHTFETGVFSSELIFVSERDRFADVSYSIMFTPADENVDSEEVGRTITVVNPSIPLSEAGDKETDTEDADEVSEDDTRTEKPEPAPIRYRTIEVPIYEIPKSDPNGYTELEIAFRNVGTIDNSNRFTPKSTLESGSRGAVQFEVKNTGTKTSTSWEFEAVLPSGMRYESKRQDALKPNERAIITIVFDTAGAPGVQDIEVEIDGGDDRSSRNNSFSWAILVK